MSDCVNSELSHRNSLLSFGPFIKFPLLVAIRAAPPAARPQHYKPVSLILCFFFSSLPFPPVPPHLTRSAPLTSLSLSACGLPERILRIFSSLCSCPPPPPFFWFFFKKKKLMTHHRRKFKETGCVTLVL